jgi:glycosyltransferase involved in cell wall biosynthesis
MEMMARGKCVLSTAVDSIPDYITHLENGLLISANDEDKIVDEAISLLELLISNPDLKRKIGEQAYRYASDKFSWEHFKEFYVNLLR